MSGEFKPEEKVVMGPLWEKLFSEELYKVDENAFPGFGLWRTEGFWGMASLWKWKNGSHNLPQDYPKEDGADIPPRP
jgi:hypothetical protein